jgi:hypothetical protein
MLQKIQMLARVGDSCIAVRIAESPARPAEAKTFIRISRDCSFRSEADFQMIFKLAANHGSSARLDAVNELLQSMFRRKSSAGRKAKQPKKYDRCRQ